MGHPNPNGNQYPHLPAHLQAWAATIPPLAQPEARGRRRRAPAPEPLPGPANLQAWAAAIPPLPQPLARGRRGTAPAPEPGRRGRRRQPSPGVEVPVDTFMALRFYCFSSYISIFAVYFKISLDFKHFYFYF